MVVRYVRCWMSFVQKSYKILNSHLKAARKSHLGYQCCFIQECCFLPGFLRLLRQGLGRRARKAEKCCWCFQLLNPSHGLVHNNRLIQQFPKTNVIHGCVVAARTKWSQSNQPVCAFPVLFLLYKLFLSSVQRGRLRFAF